MGMWSYWWMILAIMTWDTRAGRHWAVTPIQCLAGHSRTSELSTLSRRFIPLILDANEMVNASGRIVNWPYTTNIERCQEACGVQ